MNQKQKQFEKKVAGIYAKANKLTQAKAEKYIATFEEQYGIEKLNAAALTGRYRGMTDYQAQQSLKAWLNEKMSGKDWEAIRGQMADLLCEADSLVIPLENVFLIDVFMDAASQEAFWLTKQAAKQNIRVSFDIFNRRSAERLTSQKKLFPKLKKPTYYTTAKAVKEWHEKQIQKCVQSAIIQGKPIEKLAGELRNVTDMSRKQSIRAARTAMTGAHNAGIQQRWEELDEKYGIKVQKEWIAANDDRTRETHAELDGERVPYDEEFSNGLMYPGDPSGDGEEVWNCRCTMRSIFEGINDEDRKNNKK